MAAIETWRHRGRWRYNIVAAAKLVTDRDTVRTVVPIAAPAARCPALGTRLGEVEVETWDAIRSRRNVRSNGQGVIAPQDLDQILETARRTPSAGNQQAWDLVVCTDRQHLIPSCTRSSRGVAARLVSNLVSIGAFGPRLVADASGAPVLRDQGPVGRPGTVRPIIALENRELAKLLSDRLLSADDKAQRARAPRGVPETGQWSCCTIVFVDQTAEDIAAVDLLGGWRFRHALVL